MSNITEDIFQAIDIITSERLKQLSYDVTKKCTIVAVDDKTNGHYIVTDGSIKFDAYSDSTKYRVDDIVRVTIPNGDFTQTKYIEGKYVTSDAIKPITYVSPLESVLDVTNNILPDIVASESYGLISNGSQLERPIWAAELKNAAWADLQNNGIYNTLFIRADFQCLLADYDMRAGEYGIKADLYVRGLNGDGYTIYSADLSNKDMFGNPYSFLIFSTQEKKFDITNIGTVDKIRVYLYQNNNFMHYDGRSTIRIEGSDFFFDNIIAKNIYLGFGSELSTIDDNTLTLYTTGDSSYRIDNSSETNRKEIGLLWYNKSDDNKYIGFSDGLYDPDYDEDYYIDISSHDTRLTSEIGKAVPEDEEGLRLSADSVELANLTAEIRQLITRELHTTIRSFQDRIQQIVSADETVRSYLRDLLDSENGKLKVADFGLEDFIKKAQTYYANNLNQAHQYYAKDGDLGEYIEYIGTKTLYEDFNGILDVLEEALYDKDDVLYVASEVITSVYTGFKGIYDSYKIRLNNLWAQVAAKWRRCNEMLDGVEENIEAYYEKDYIYEPYVKEDLSSYHNKYCIYWYRYIPGYVNEQERFMEKEWQRITVDIAGNSMKNFGLPSKNEETDYYNPKGNALFEVDLNGQQAIEKFAAVVFYNHEMFKSNILEFVNQDRIPDDTTLDAADAIVISHGDYSQDSYQLYGLDNQLVDSADAYRKRKLKLSYEGKINGDEALIGAQIYWYIPKNATMINWAAEDLLVKDAEGNESSKFYNDLSSDNGPKSEHYREGFTCFYRTIGADENGELISDDRYFTYRIKNYLVATSSNNIIYCKIVKGQYVFETEILLNFGVFGTSGTNYTLAVEPATTQPAVVLNRLTPEDAALKLSVKLFDSKNEEIPIVFESDENNVAKGITFTTYGPTGKNFSFAPPEASNEVNTVLFTPHHESTEDGDDDTIAVKPTDCLYCAGEVSVKFVIPQPEDGETVDNSRTITLTAYYPAAVEYGDYYIEGASTVVYSSSGDNPVYFKNPYRIFDNATDKEIKDVVWDVVCYNKKGEIANADLQIAYAPKLNKNGALQPSNMFLQDADIYPVVRCRQNGKVLWAQSIIMIQNRYPSAMLNEWDGSLVIDEENGTIMSTMVGAGRKNNDNQFEGVLMGDVARGAGFDVDNGSGIGIYGFHKGAQSFAFLNNGTGFIGKSGAGRILFDGNNSTITSASYRNGGQGLFIDLDSSPYLVAKGTDGVKTETLIYLGNENYYLQSFDYKNNSSGMRIDLNNGYIDAYKFKLQTSSFIMNSNGYPYLKIVDTDTGEDTVIVNITKNSFALNSSDGAVTLTSFGSNDTNNAYFRINSDGTNLVCISRYSLYFQTSNFNSDKKTGMRLDLKSDPGIEAYGKFKLYVTGGGGFVSLDTTQTDIVFNINDHFYTNWNGITTIVTDSATVYEYPLKFHEYAEEFTVGLGAHAVHRFVGAGTFTMQSIISENSIGAEQYIIGKEGAVSNHFYPYDNDSYYFHCPGNTLLYITNDNSSTKTTLSEKYVAAQRGYFDHLVYNKLAFGEIDKDTDYFTISIEEQIETPYHGIFEDLLSFTSGTGGNASMFVSGLISHSIMTNVIGTYSANNLEIVPPTKFIRSIEVTGASNFSKIPTIPTKSWSSDSIVSTNAASEGWVTSWGTNDLYPKLNTLNTNLNTLKSRVDTIESNYATKTDVATMKANYESEISSLNNTINYYQTNWYSPGEVSEIRSGYESDISDLNDKIQDLEDKIAELEKDDTTTT